MKDFRQSVATFLRQEQGKKSANTIKAYRHALTGFTTWYLSRGDPGFTIADLRPEDVEAYKQNLLDTGFRPATVNQHLAALRGLFRWAQQRRLIVANPADSVRGAPKTARHPRWLSRAEERRLWQAVEKEGNVRDQVLLHLMLDSGLRVGEIAALLLDDVKVGSDQANVVTIRYSRHARTVPLTVECVKLLRVHLADRLGEDPVSPLFFGRRRERLHSNGIRHMVDKYAALTDLEQCTPQILRHTFARRAIDRGLSVEKVAALLGIEDLNTMKGYLRANGS